MDGLSGIYNRALFYVRRHWLPALTEQEKQITLAAVGALATLAALFALQGAYRAFYATVPQNEEQGKEKTRRKPTMTPIRKNIPNPPSTPSPQPVEQPKNPPPPPPPPPPPFGGPIPPPPPGGIPGLDTSGKNETEEEKKLRQEKAKQTRAQKLRMELDGLYTGGSLLTQKTLEDLRNEIKKNTQYVEKLRASPGAQLPEFQKDIEKHDALIAEDNAKIEKAEIKVIKKMTGTDFTSALSRYPTDELKLIMGSFQETQPQEDAPHPLIEFYQSYPNQELRDLCAANQKLYQMVFENSSMLFLTALATLIEQREKGLVPEPGQAPAANNNQKAPQRRLGGLGMTNPVRGDITEELQRRFAQNGGPGLQKSQEGAQKENADQGAANLPPLILKPVVKAEANIDKEKKLRAGYMLEKLDNLAQAYAKPIFDENQGALADRKAELGQALKTAGFADQVRLKKELVDINKEIAIFNDRITLAENYSKQQYTHSSNLEGALKDPFVIRFDLAQQAEAYANTKLEEIRNR